MGLGSPPAILIALTGRGASLTITIMETALSIQIDLMSAVVLVIVAVHLKSSASDRSADARYFSLILWTTFGMLALDAASRLAGLASGPIAYAAANWTNALYFSLHAVPSLGFLLYAESVLRRDGARARKLLLPLGAIAAGMAALALSSPFTGFVFSVDPVAGYRRGPGFGLFALLQFAILASASLPLLFRSEDPRRAVRLILLAYPVAVGLAALLQTRWYAVLALWPTATLCILVAAMGIQRRRITIDYLTGVANRRSIDEILERLVVDGRAIHGSLGGILLDLDDFKSINDRLGHDMGDRALEDAAELLRSSVRREDFVGRMGGDEFLVLLDGASAELLGEIVERIERGLASKRLSERPYRLSLSVGAALYDPLRHGSAEAFVKALDTAMYGQKERRKSGRQAVSG